ncbi:hypothetical protein F4804DRAFT_334360 [Jackrogersella minutella]|nr:hypothetical protein F4804DRAFT_334360 [Jackrogersella minutella]
MGFAKTLVIAIVVTVVSVLAFFAIIYYIALNWSKIIRRATPDRWASPPSEKTVWPQQRTSGESYFSSPIPSPRSSRMSGDPMSSNLKSFQDEPITPPRNVKQVTILIPILRRNNPDYSNTTATTMTPMGLDAAAFAGLVHDVPGDAEERGVGLREQRREQELEARDETWSCADGYAGWCAG